MGRLPSQWAGKVINDRFPYAMVGELTLSAGAVATQFPDSTFLHSIDKPFEVHRVIPRVVANDSSSVPLTPQPDQDLLAELVRIFITNLGINQPMMKATSRVIALTKGSAERTWEWAEPQTLERGQEFQVTATPLATFPAVSSLSTITVILAFEGFLLQVAPPSDNR